MNASRRPPTNAEKAAGLIALLKECPVVRIHFLIGEPKGPPSPGVCLPPSVIAASETGACALDIGLGLARPIPDLAIGENGIGGTFSFSATPFYVTVPWEVIGGVEIIDDGKPKKKAPHLIEVTADIPFDARYQDFALVPPPGKPVLRIV